MYSYLKEREIQIKRNHYVYTHIIEYYKDKDKIFEEILEYIKYLHDTLISKRNKTIIGHGTEGCSLPEIKEHADFFFKKTKELMEKLKILKDVKFIDEFLKLYNLS